MGLPSGLLNTLLSPAIATIHHHEVISTLNSIRVLALLQQLSVLEVVIGPIVPFVLRIGDRV